MRRITCVKGEKWNCILFNKGGTAGLASSLTVTIFFYFGGGVCMKYTALKGTKDVLPGESHLWQSLEYNIRFLTSLYGFREIRTPVIEHTELFLRGVGDTTDIVQKETYTFDDRGGRSITLKPEGTGGAVRAFVEAGLFNEPQPTKMYYLNCPVFRYEKPQAGRLREHHQFGVEVFGSASPYTDAEVISLALALFQTLGLEGLVVHINSIGCPNCRPEYQKKLKEYFAPHIKEMCKDCQSRFDRNPLRLLDCKNPHDQELAAGAPSLEECLCEECKAHFEGLKELLTAAGVDYVVDHNLVRGLDYYTKTAFEIQYAPLGAQSAVCGGGRYDGLIEEIGGPATPGIGFAMGMERVLLAIESQNLLPQFDNSIDVFVVCPGSANFTLAFKEAIALRREGLKVEFDFLGRSMKAQMKQANRLAAKYVLILGEDEVARGCAVLRNMSTSEQTEIPIQDITSILKTEVQSHE